MALSLVSRCRLVHAGDCRPANLVRDHHERQSLCWRHSSRRRLCRAPERNRCRADRCAHRAGMAVRRRARPLRPSASRPRWSSGRPIPGACPTRNFAKGCEAAGLLPGQPVYFLCRSGVRSMHAAAAMTALGYGPCYNIAEGFRRRPRSPRPIAARSAAGKSPASPGARAEHPSFVVLRLDRRTHAPLLARPSVSVSALRSEPQHLAGSLFVTQRRRGAEIPCQALGWAPPRKGSFWDRMAIPTKHHDSVFPCNHLSRSAGLLCASASEPAPRLDRGACQDFPLLGFPQTRNISLL